MYRKVLESSPSPSIRLDPAADYAVLADCWQERESESEEETGAYEEKDLDTPEEQAAAAAARTSLQECWD